MADVKRIMIIDFTNYEDYPIGGYLSFARNLMFSFGSSLALVGITTSSEDPVGKWFKKNINGTVYDFFAMARYNKTKTKHIIPDRLVSYCLVKNYLRKIREIKINNIFLQRQEMLLATNSRSENICFCFAGLENPLSISKYKYAQYFSKLFERVFFKRIKIINTILASGDNNAIREMIGRSKGLLRADQITMFPSRINTDIFKPLNRNEIRQKLNISSGTTVILTTGRLAPLKGWKFMIDSFKLFMNKVSDTLLYFIGEGEDYDLILKYISDNSLTNHIILAGKKSQAEVALFLNAADLYIMASYKEGWSTSLMEAIACGVPACVTDFSSASEIIIEGENGFIVREHREDLFIEAMMKSVKLPRPVKNDNVLRFAADKLKEDLLGNWQLS
ncbi:MAG TPA: glycosyltransferase [Bacteroidales bacterium]|jgi:glycosyltransferase involved in cell wall biosynthesis|nr:glycosyltransferase [Clostridiaceae bacterium]HOP59461.1 glycosyltransferase [Bacteroidales bacterium]